MLVIHYSHVEIREVSSCRLQRPTLGFKLLSQISKRGARSRQVVVRCEFIDEDWGSCLCEVNRVITLGHPVLIRYSNHE